MASSFRKKLATTTEPWIIACPLLIYEYCNPTSPLVDVFCRSFEINGAYNRTLSHWTQHGWLNLPFVVFIVKFIVQLLKFIAIQFNTMDIFKTSTEKATILLRKNENNSPPNQSENHLICFVRMFCPNTTKKNSTRNSKRQNDETQTYRHASGAQTRDKQVEYRCRSRCHQIEELFL